MMIGPTGVMTGVMMPGGWHYRENGRMIIEEAESYTDLVNKVAAYRGFSGLPLGDPQRDVDNYICGTFPNMCGRTVPPEEDGVDKVELSYGVPVRKTPRERVMQWVANRIHGAGQVEFVDSEKAERRAQICAECPKQVRWNEPIEGCPGCQVYVEEVGSMLVKLRRNNRLAENRISGQSCTVAGHDLETACWLEEDALRHRRNYAGQFPPFCWMNDL